MFPCLLVCLGLTVKDHAIIYSGLVTSKQNKHVLRASREEGSLFYGLLLFIFSIIYMGVPKFVRCLGPLWVLIPPWL